MALGIPDMTKGIDPDIRKKVEFTAHGGEAIHHIYSLMDEEFAKSAEGKEAAYLQGIVDSFIDNDEHFISKFVAGAPGKRGVDQMISGLEHPDSEIKPDSKLIKRLKRLAEDMDKKDIPSEEEWIFFRRKIAEVKGLQTTADIAAFNSRLNNLIADIKTRYPKSSIAEILKKEDKGKLPKYNSLKNLKGEANLIQYLLDNLLTRPRGFNKPAFEEYLENKLKIAAGTFRKEAGFVQDVEKDEDFPNWFGFHTAVQKLKKKHPMIRALALTGDDDIVNIVLEKAQGNREEFMQAFLAYERKIASEDHIAKAELDAENEIADIMHSELEKMKKEIESERKQFAEVMSSRIKELKEAHSKNLATVTEVKENLDYLDKQSLLAADLTNDDLNRISELDRSIDQNLIRASDIMKIIRARTAVFMLGDGKIDDAAFEKEIGSIIASGPSEFALKIVKNINSLHDGVTSERLTIEQFRTMMERVDDFIGKAVNQIPVLTTNMIRMTARMKRLSDEYDDLKNETDYWSDRAYHETMRGSRRIHRIVPIERYRKELDEDDWQYLGEEKKAA